MVTLYTSYLSIKDLTWDKNAHESRFYDEKDYKYVEYDDRRKNIYAESLTSQKEADRLVLEKAAQLRNIFQKILDTYPIRMGGEADLEN